MTNLQVKIMKSLSIRLITSPFLLNQFIIRIYQKNKRFKFQNLNHNQNSLYNLMNKFKCKKIKRFKLQNLIHSQNN